MTNKPVVLVIMDGVGETDKEYGNAVKAAKMPTLDELKNEGVYTTIKAHGLAVGLPSDDDMGNSEVGHNAIGCGQIYSQGAKLVNESIASGSIYQSQVWKSLVANAKDHTMHFIGLLSDGNVHSNINHLLAMLTQAKKEGLRKVRVHCLMDGRDVDETSGLIYIDMLEKHLDSLNDENFDGKIASGGGRMYITMDRYEADWEMVSRGWDAHVTGIGRKFNSAKEAIETYRQELKVNDQNLPAFVIVKDDKPVGTINDHDSVILFNFRGDRALEISRAFDNNNYHFTKSKEVDVMYAGMLEYDGDLHIPNNYLVAPPAIKETMSEYLVKNKVKTYALSETQKYGHVTYFWNGNRSEKFSNDLEDWEEIKSDICPFDEKPEMKAKEITDKLVAAINSKKYSFLRTNFPNGDMVGHTGNFEATVKGLESVDEGLKSIKEACDKNDCILIVTADHGNADEMYEKKKKENDPIKPKTSHSKNPVPFIVYNAGIKLKEGIFGLSNIAATIFDLLNLEIPKAWNQSMIQK